MVAETEARALSLLECALLGLLRQVPRSGYDLRKVFAETPFVHFSDSPGAVYPALARLERRGLLVRAPEEAGGGRGRRTLRLTAAGRAALRHWLRLPVNREDVTRRPDRLMLRFAFMEEVAGRKACVVFLVAYEAELAAYVAELERFRRQNAAVMTLAGRLAFDSGLGAFRAQRRWARRAIHALEEETMRASNDSRRKGRGPALGASRA
jgi:DNA-binding PadR family transcriptional regulator